MSTENQIEEMYAIAKELIAFRPWTIELLNAESVEETTFCTWLQLAMDLQANDTVKGLFRVLMDGWTGDSDDYRLIHETRDIKESDKMYARIRDALDNEEEREEKMSTKTQVTVDPFEYNSPAQQISNYREVVFNFIKRQFDTLNRYCDEQCAYGMNDPDDATCNACYVYKAKKVCEEAREEDARKS